MGQRKYSGLIYYAVLALSEITYCLESTEAQATRNARMYGCGLIMEDKRPSPGIRERFQMPGGGPPVLVRPAVRPRRPQNPVSLRYSISTQGV